MSAYDFGPWPLLEGVTALPTAVTMVRLFDYAAAAATAAACTVRHEQRIAALCGVHLGMTMWMCVTAVVSDQAPMQAVTDTGCCDSSSVCITAFTLAGPAIYCSCVHQWVCV